MCQFVAIKPSCGCLMKRCSDSDSCQEWDRWVRSLKMERSKCGLLSSTHCAAQQAERNVRTRGSRWTLKGRSVVVVRGSVSDKQDIDSTTRRSRTDCFLLTGFFFLQYLIFSGGRGVWLWPAPWSDGSLAGTEKEKSHRSDRRQQWEKMQKPFN